MRSDLYDSLANTEETHWWFQARKSIILALLDKELAAESHDLAILDVGAGTGMLAEALTRFGRVTALEAAPEALAHLERREGLTIVRGTLPNPDLPRAAYDLVTLFDVLEHIEDDGGAMADLSALVRPGWGPVAYGPGAPVVVVRPRRNPPSLSPLPARRGRGAGSSQRTRGALLVAFSDAALPAVPRGTSCAAPTSVRSRS